MFVKRRIDVVFTLAEGTFGGSGLNTLTVSGLRIVAKIVKPGGNSFGQLQATIFGLTFSQINQFSTLGQTVFITSGNSVTILAGDDRRGMAMAFKGNIYNAYADMQAAPDVGFVISAQTGYSDAVAPSPALSYKEGVNVATVMQDLANQMKLKFENNGVSAILTDSYLSGSAINQVRRAAANANIYYAIDNGVLAIWPKSGSRTVSSVPVISSKTIMNGYPTYTKGGIQLKAVYDPDIVFGGQVKVISDLKPANGIWNINYLDIDIASEQPGGSWFMTIGANNPQFGLQIIK